MIICKGSRFTDHPQIVHDEGLHSCPLCELTDKYEELDRRLEKGVAANEKLEGEIERLSAVVDELAAKLGQ